MSQCTAKSKRTGQQCQQNAMKGSTKCFHHGGSTPKGMASPHFKTGRYSKYLPKRLLEDFANALGDQDLLALSSEISLLDARLGDLIRRVDTGESGEIWKALRDTYKALNQAREIGDTVTMGVALAEIGKLITRGHMDYANWREISILIEQRRRLVESERKRLIDLHQMVRADKFMIFIQTLADSVKRNVHDKDALAAIQNDIAKLME